MNPPPLRPATALSPAPSPGTPARFHALDWVRNAAMLLGLFYHLQFFDAASFAQMQLGKPPPFNPKGAIDAWLHAFRMPLFFLISGFFACMMLRKYGLKGYLARRWWRIGGPLILAFLAFGLLRTYFPKIASSAFEGMTFESAPPSKTAPAPVAAIRPQSLTTPTASTTTPPPTAPGPAFPMPALPSKTWLAAVLQPFNAAQAWILETAPWAGSGLRLLGGRTETLRTGNFHFEHLWFLWYLLVFCTLAPLLALPLGRLPMRAQARLDDLGLRLLRFNLLGPALGLVALPASLLASGFDWSVQHPGGFFATLPDCFVQYYPDLPLYFIYFLGGWFLFRLRNGLPSLANFWLWNLTLGIVAFAFSQSLFKTHGLQFGDPHYGTWRLTAFTLYTVGAAASSVGLLGFFQRHFNRPSALGRYFTDTMLWIYLVQLAIIPHILPWLQSDRAPWWAASLAGMVAVTAVALVLFELIVRPTALMRVFGPARRGSG